MTVNVYNLWCYSQKRLPDLRIRVVVVFINSLASILCISGKRCRTKECGQDIFLTIALMLFME